MLAAGWLLSDMRGAIQRGRVRANGLAQKFGGNPIASGGMKTRKAFVSLLFAACIAVLAACGGDESPSGSGSADGPGSLIRLNDANARTVITVGSKNFTEQRILGQLYALAFKAAGYRVATKLDLGNEKRALKAVQTKRIDGYPEYTGTALLSFCDVSANKIPKDPAVAFGNARDCLDGMGLVAFPPTPFTSSNEVGVTAATARRLKLRTISDLKEHDQDLVLYGTPECRFRTDCLLGLTRVYGLKFRRFAGVDPVERHDVLRRRNDAVSIVYTTDPQNKRDNVVLLEDDRGMFPPYNSTFLVRDDIARSAGPDLPKVIERVQVGLTDEVMQELNARVDLDKQTPREVALSYLVESGLLAAAR
jgi:osmoprotectant transport system substrate-binding protein